MPTVDSFLPRIFNIAEEGARQGRDLAPIPVVIDVTSERCLAIIRRIAEAYAKGWIPVRPTEHAPHGLLHPRQALFLLLEQEEAMYGGAAGGGKSDCLLMGAVLYCDVPSSSGILFRRTHVDLAQPGGLMDRSHEWWANTPKEHRPRWDGTNKTYRFPSGAQIKYGYMQNPRDHFNYQGGEYQYAGFDETTQFAAVQFRYVARSRMRRVVGSPVPIRVRCASNPGGEGHAWVKERYVDPGDPRRPFVSAKIADNPSLSQEEYEAMLEGLDPTTKAQLLAGDWEARDPGDYFRREWFGPPLQPLEAHPGHAFDPALSIRCRSWDLAASAKPEDEKGARARTAGVRIAKHASGLYAVEHTLAFWKTGGDRNDTIVQLAHGDGYATPIIVEQEAGGGGKDQAENLQRILRREGFRCIIVLATAAKEQRADPVATELENGYNAQWSEGGVRILTHKGMNEYFDEVEGFPDGDLLDLADATAQGFNYLKDKTVGGAAPIDEAAAAARTAEWQAIEAARKQRETIDPNDYAETDDDAADSVHTGHEMESLAARGRWHKSSASRRGRRRRF